jgi:hypothetical protein
MISTYYIRIFPDDKKAFEEYAERNGITVCHLSQDLTNGSHLYSSRMTIEEEMIMRISFPFKGFMNFNKTLKNLTPVDQS